MNFRPHRLSYLSTSNGYEDDNGNWIHGTSQYIGSIECRAEPNGKAMQIALPDGKAYVYSYIVYLDVDCREFRLDESVKIIDLSGDVLYKGACKGFHRGQLNVRLWL